jgi:hypothetical protein
MVAAALQAVNRYLRFMAGRDRMDTQPSPTGG